MIIDLKRVKERRDQIAAIPKNTDEQAALCARVVAYLDEALAASPSDKRLAALWVTCDKAMESRLEDCSWQPPTVEKKKPEPEPEPEAEPKKPVKRTRKPRRRRKASNG